MIVEVNPSLRQYISKYFEKFVSILFFKTTNDTMTYYEQNLKTELNLMGFKYNQVLNIREKH